MSSIHKRIKERRQALELSMEDLAERVGVKSWQTVQQWENGSTAPSRKRMEAVATALQVSQSWLATGAEPAEEKKTASRAATQLPKRQDPAIAEVVRLMESTDDTGRAIVLSHVQAALDKYKPAKRNLAR